MSIVDTPIHPRAAWYGELTRYAWQSIGFETRPRPIVQWQYVHLEWKCDPLLDISPIDTLKYEMFDDSPKLCMCDRCQRARFIQDGGKWHGGNSAAPVGVGGALYGIRLPPPARRAACVPVTPVSYPCGIRRRRRWRGRR